MPDVWDQFQKADSGDDWSQFQAVQSSKPNVKALINQKSGVSTYLPSEGVTAPPKRSTQTSMRAATSAEAEKFSRENLAQQQQIDQRTRRYDPSDPLGRANWMAQQEMGSQDFATQAMGALRSMLAGAVDPRMLPLEVGLGGAPALLRGTAAPIRAVLGAEKGRKVIGALQTGMKAGEAAGAGAGAALAGKSAYDLAREGKYGAAIPFAAAGTLAALGGAKIGRSILNPKRTSAAPAGTAATEPAAPGMGTQPQAPLSKNLTPPGLSNAEPLGANAAVQGAVNAPTAGAIGEGPFARQTFKGNHGEIRGMPTSLESALMETDVLPALKNQKVLDAVVRLLPVDVVDNLAGQKGAPHLLAHDQSVLFDALSSDQPTSVSIQARDATMRALASLGAKLRGAGAAGNDIEIGPALRASDLSPSEAKSLLNVESGLVHSQLYPGTASESIGGMEGASQVKTTTPVGKQPSRTQGVRGRGRGGMEPIQQGPETAQSGQAEGQAATQEVTPRVTGISERVRTGMAGEGRAQEYQPGVGASPQEMKTAGRQIIASGVDPESHLAMMEKRGSAVSGEDMAVLAAHDDTLVRAADKARDAARSNPNDPAAKALADEAVNAEQKWYDRISKYRTEFQKIGTAQQGEVDVDSGSFTSLSRYFEKVNNRPLKEGSPEEATVQTHIDRINKLEGDLASRDAKIAEMMKAQAAKVPATVGKTKIPTDPNELAQHFAKRKQDGSLYPSAPRSRESGAIRIRKGDPQFTTDEVRAINQYANNYLAKENPATGRTYETADVIAKTAHDLGLTTDEVNHAFTRSQVNLKPVTDEMYALRAARRDAKKAAIDYVENANKHPASKLISAIPNIYRSTKVFGHGTVGMTTHGGPNLLLPFSERAVYWPGQARQLAMAFNKSLKGSEIIHEKMLTDIENDPLYNTARQGGLKVDTMRMQDDVQKYARFLGGTGNIISRLSKRGDMGMDVLKWARMQDFDRKWNSLSDDLKTPDMAKELSNMVNHSWGAGDSGLGKAGGVLFSPSLQAAHWGRVIGDPAKTIRTYMDVAFNQSKNTSPEQVQIAKMRLKRAAELAGVYGTALIINDAYLSGTDSKDRVNFTDPTKADWLLPKVGGKTIGMGMSQGPIRLIAQVARDTAESDSRRLANDVWRYGEGKLNPAIGTAIQTGMRRDYFGRPLPFASDKIKEAGKKAGKEPLTTTEYLWSMAPIPAEGIAREYFEVMRKNGAEKDDALKMWNAIGESAKVAPAELLGFRVTEPFPERQKTTKIKFGSSSKRSGTLKPLGGRR